MLLFKEPLKFVFSGYSIWLEPEQFQNDLELVVEEATARLGLPHGVPTPHVTAIYGMTHLSEAQARKKFQQIFSDNFAYLAWPVLKHAGFQNGIELNGVNGGEMDMAWMEGSFETNENHELLLDLLYNAFYNDSDELTTLQQEQQQKQRHPWAPHVSFAYDNENNPIPDEVLLDLIETYPTLKNDRRVTGISLWSTEGTIDQWKCLDRVCLKQQELLGAENDSVMEAVPSAQPQ